MAVRRATGEGRIGARPDVAQRKLVNASLLYAAVVPFDFYPVAAGRSATFFASLVLLFTFAQYIAAGKRPKVIRSGYAVPAFMLALWALVTTTWSVDFAGSFTAWLSLVLQLLTVVALATVLPMCWRRWLVWYLRGMTVLAGLLLTQTADADRAGRATLAGADENTLAMIVCMGLAAALFSLVLDREKKRRIFVFLQLCVIVPAIVHIGSRTGMGTLVVTGLVAAVVAVGIGAKDKVKALLLAAIALVAGYFALRYLLSAGVLPERVAQFLRAPEITDVARQEIVASYKATMDNWELFGIGYGADAAYLEANGGRFQHAHSLFWRTWIEMGYLGLLIFGWLLLGAVKGSWRARWRLLSVMLWVPVATFAVTLGGDRTSQFWIAIAFGAVVFSSGRERETTTQPEVSGGELGSFGQRPGARIG